MRSCKRAIQVHPVPILTGMPVLEQHRLREHHCRVPRCIFVGAGSLRTPHGSPRHETRAHAHCALVFGCVDTDAAGARFLFSFVGMRFLLGAGESGNWPGATKAVSEWFPRQERALATALFDSGSSLGAAIAPLIVLPLFFRWGTRAAFALHGMLGILWLLVWQLAYESPEYHARLSAAERHLIVAGRGDTESTARPKPRWRDLLQLPQMWGVVIARAFTDPVFFFVADWFSPYTSSPRESRSGTACSSSGFHL